MNHRPDNPQPPGEESQPTRSLNLYWSILFTGGGTGITVVSLFLETMIAVRLLDKNSYGIYVLLLAVVNLLVIVVDFGCKTAIPQLMSGSDRTRQAALVNSVLLFRLAVMILTAALIWFSRDLVIWLVPSLEPVAGYMVYIPMMLAAISIDELFFGILQGFHAYKHIAIAQILRSLLRLILTVFLLVVFDLGLAALVYSWTISFAIAIGYQYFVTPIPKQPSYQHSLLKEVLRFGFPIHLTRFLATMGGRVDKLLLGLLAGPASTAIYDVAQKVPLALQRMFESFTAVYYPTIATLVAEGNDRQANHLLNRSLRLVSISLALIALVAVLFSQEVVTLLFSEKYAESSLVFGLMVVGLHMNTLVSLMGYTLTGAGYPERSLGENSVRLVLGISANLVLIPPFQYLGPALANMFADYSASPVVIWLLRRSNFQVLVAPILKQTALLLLCSILIWWSQPGSLVYKLAIFAAFVAGNFMLKAVSVDDLKLMVPDSARRMFKQNARILKVVSIK